MLDTEASIARAVLGGDLAKRFQQPVVGSIADGVDRDMKTGTVRTLYIVALHVG